jgi:hypothetical protein
MEKWYIVENKIVFEFFKQTHIDALIMWDEHGEEHWKESR